MVEFRGTYLVEEEVSALKDLEELLKNQIPIVSDIFEERERVDDKGKKRISKLEMPGIVIQDNHVRKMCIIPYDALRGGKILKNLPETFGNFSYLEELIINRHELENLPRSIGMLKSLVFLNLDSNQLKILPDSFVELTSIKKIDLTSNELENLPILFGNLKTLEILNLTSNKLKSFPQGFGNLENLKELDFINNKITYLPESFRNLKNIKKINLSSNLFHQIPEVLGELDSLQSLEIGNNNITSSLDNPKLFKNLKILQIKGFITSSIPEFVKYLTNLERLTIFYPISSVPDFIGDLQSMKIFSISDLQSNILPESITKLQLLQVLHIFGGELTSLPESFGNLSSLIQVYIFKNKIEFLPDSIGNLQTLKSLRLNGNNLRDLPTSIINLTNLEELWLQGNNFTSLPTYLWKLKNLKSLWVEKNPLNKEWEIIEKENAKAILDLCKKREPISIFISCHTEDMKRYRIEDISKILHKGEIKDVFYNTGPTEDSITSQNFQKLKQSHIFIFVASRNSVSNPNRCLNELKFAQENEIAIIPILGLDLKWADLAIVELNRMLGIEFSIEEFGVFCEKLYEYIFDYKRNVDLFDREQGRIDKALFEIRYNLNNLMKSDEYKQIFRSVNYEISRLKAEFKENKVDFKNFFANFVEILKKQ